MMARIGAVLLAIWALATATPADARRVAVVIVQNAYGSDPLGGDPAKGLIAVAGQAAGNASAKVARLTTLANARLDAERLVGIFVKHGFEVISCDGGKPGCFDATHAPIQQALATLKQKAQGADTALAFFIGHGMASSGVNIVTPIDASLDCTTGTVANGIPVEALTAATETARQKLVILDACRDNQIPAACPGLKRRAQSFTRIEAGALQNFRPVTATQFGQQALDGLPGAHSPFAQSLFAALKKVAYAPPPVIPCAPQRATLLRRHGTFTALDPIPARASLDRDDGSGMWLAGMTAFECNVTPLKAHARTLPMRRMIATCRKHFFVYITASRARGVLYVGVASALPARSSDHRENRIEGFTTRYWVGRLVYREAQPDAETAFHREKTFEAKAA